MRTHLFDVIATGLDHEADDFEAKFYDGGCDDALIVVRGGLICVSFAREASSMDEAIVGAVDAVKATGATIIRIDRDLDPDTVS
jgi:microcompartment protein CcmK/EutM